MASQSERYIDISAACYVTSAQPATPHAGSSIWSFAANMSSYGDSAKIFIRHQMTRGNQWRYCGKIANAVLPATAPSFVGHAWLGYGVHVECSVPYPADIEAKCRMRVTPVLDDFDPETLTWLTYGALSLGTPLTMDHMFHDYKGTADTNFYKMEMCTNDFPIFVKPALQCYGLQFEVWGYVNQPADDFLAALQLVVP